MITIIRRIRRSLMASGSGRKYMLYAVGEIALVVIGILIALQINNWNEDRKIRNFEREILRDIDNGLQLNMRQLESGITSCNIAAASCQIVLHYLDGDINYHDSLLNHFSRTIKWFRPTVTNVGYESLKTYGRHLVRNDSIRHQLEIFDYEWSNVLHERQEEFFNETVSPFLSQHFTLLDFSLNVLGNAQMKPFDAAELKRSRQYYNIISTIKLNRESQAWWYNRWINNMNRLSAMIKDELNNAH